MIRMVHPVFQDLSIGAFAECYGKFLSGASNRPDRPEHPPTMAGWQAGPLDQWARAGTLEVHTAKMVRGPPAVVKASKETGHQSNA